MIQRKRGAVEQLFGRLQGFMRSLFRPLWAEKASAHLSWVFFVVFYCIIVNLPYWIASYDFGFLDRLGWFCIEFALVGLVALFVPPVFSAVLLLSMIVLDALCAVCVTYFLMIPVTMSNIGIFQQFSPQRRFAAVAVMLLTLLIAAFAAYMPGKSIRGKDRWRAAACLVTFAVLCLAVDFVNATRATGHMPNPLGMSGVADGVNLSISRAPRLARIPIARLVRLEMLDTAKRANVKAGSIPSASAVAISSAGLAPGKSRQELPNLVIVMVESWGISTDLPLNNAMVQPYLQPDMRARYDVVQGVVPFNGATVDGEARELCGFASGYHLMSASADELKDCLPARLAALGYYNIALHGMGGSVFSRSSWYRTVGFQEIWFNDQFKQQGLPDCNGPLVGTCDADIAGWIRRRLEVQNNDPYFVHWMTLNSHLPVFVPSVLANGAACLPALSLTPESPLCSWYQLVANVHQSVAQLAMGALARPTIFVIVGDHAPPFVAPELRKRFSYSVVPYVVLLPRPVNNSSSRTLARNSIIPHGKATQPSGQTP
jgi:phosphoglycerol transferase MdoB-like AlkP superfamily enzyme